MRRWWRQRTLRARLMLIGVAGLMVGFLVGGVALVGVLGIVLQRSVDTEITATARQVATMLDANSLPLPVPVAAGDQVQIVDALGRVRASSVDADPLVPMLTAGQLDSVRAGKHLNVEGGGLSVHTGLIRVVGVVAGPANDRQTVLVGRSMTDALRGLGLLRTHLLVLFPLLIIGAAIVAWRVIGASLRPVEALRAGAEEITGAGGGVRLPVPEGEDEVHRLAVTLNGMLDRLESGRARQREFVADAAHELRSPLANMRTQLEVAQHLGTSTDWPEVAGDVLADTERLSKLVDDLLLLARADTAPLPAHLAEPVELAALVRQTAARYGDGVRVSTKDTDCPVWTMGDPDECRRILANLLDNAVRHARTGAVAAVTSEGDRALITVTDDGPGIAPADRDRVFERFTRLDDSRTLDTGGAGLGLAIVRELVRRHGGTVTLGDATTVRDAAVAEQMRGLRVEVRLPLYAETTG